MCSKQFPRSFQCETEAEESGYYVTYRRRPVHAGGSMVKRNMNIDGRNEEVEIDNRWVVPYAPFLSRKFDCHLNVELSLIHI